MEYCRYKIRNTAGTLILFFVPAKSINLYKYLRYNILSCFICIFMLLGNIFVLFRYVSFGGKFRTSLKVVCILCYCILTYFIMIWYEI